MRWWNRFHVRLTLFHGVVVFVVLTVMAVVFYQTGVGLELEGLQARLRATVTILSRGIDADAVAALPPEGAPDAPLVKALRERFAFVAGHDPDINTIYVLRRTSDPNRFRFVIDYATDNQPATVGEPYDASALPRLRQGAEQVTVEKTLYRDQWGASMSGYAPLIRRDGDSIGLVGVDVAAARVEEMSERVLLTTLALYGVAGALLVVMAIVVGQQLRGPLQSINEAAERIAEGDFDVHLGLGRRDELGLVGRHFDRIAGNLKERDLIRDAFGRYVSPDVARRVLTDRSAQALGGEERAATILFADIQGYSTMNEKVPPGVMVGILNTYLTAMSEIIDAHDGCIIEFLGDAILCVFNTPNEVRGHAEAAVRCALAMSARLEQLNEGWRELEVAKTWREQGYESLRARIGIHTGVVIAGNIGSPRRMKYSVLGDVVNVASRLEQMNKRLGTWILLSAATVAELPADLRARATSHGEQDVRGRDGKVEVFSV